MIRHTLNTARTYRAAIRAVGMINAEGEAVEMINAEGEEGIVGERISIDISELIQIWRDAPGLGTQISQRLRGRRNNAKA